MHITSDFSPTFTKVRQEFTIKRSLIALFKQVLWPFVSVYSGVCNLMWTNHWLTTTRVLDPLFIDYNIIPGGREYQNLPEMRRAIQDLKNGCYLSFHIGLKKMESHSTLLIIGKDFQGKSYAIFFDARGSCPTRARLLQKEFEIEERPLENKEPLFMQQEENLFFYFLDQSYRKIPEAHFETLAELYQALTQGMLDPPELMHSRSDIQWDRVSCTAYTAAFFKKFMEDANLPEFKPKHLMQKVANGEYVKFWEARKEVSDLRRPSLSVQKV